MNKFFKILSVFTVIFSLTFTTITISANDGEMNTENSSVKVERTDRVLTYEEAVEVLMQKVNISREEAQEMLEPSNDMQVYSDVVGNTSYHEYTDTYTIADRYSVEIGGLWQTYNYGSFRQFNECVSCWTAATGSGSYTWEEIYVLDVTESYPTTAVSLSARGVIEVAVDSSTSGGIQLGSELIGLGFERSDTVGFTTYFRYTETIGLSRSLY